MVHSCKADTQRETFIIGQCMSAQPQQNPMAVLKQAIYAIFSWECIITQTKKHWAHLSRFSHFFCDCPALHALSRRFEQLHSQNQYACWGRRFHLKVLAESFPFWVQFCEVIQSGLSTVMEFTFQVRRKLLTFSLSKLSTSSFISNFSECENDNTMQLKIWGKSFRMRCSFCIV